MYLSISFFKKILESCIVYYYIITYYFIFSYISLIQEYKPFADPVPPNTKHYQLILTKYQPVSSYMTQYHQVILIIHYLVRRCSDN